MWVEAARHSQYAYLKYATAGIDKLVMITDLVIFCGWNLRVFLQTCNMQAATTAKMQDDDHQLLLSVQ